MSDRAEDAPPRAEPRPAEGGEDSLGRFQARIEHLYGPRDRRRGLDGTFVWFVEEVGELARALKRGDRANLREEFSDVLAWLSTLASLAGIDLAEAATRYRAGCPRCGSSPCTCEDRFPQVPAP